MKNRSLVDLCCILVLGDVYWAIDFLVYSNLETLGVGLPSNLKQFTDDFTFWALIVVGVSVLAVLVWYVLGEWGLRSTTMSSSGWTVLWVVLMLLVIGTAVTATILVGTEAAENGNWYWVGLFYVGGCLLYYWLTTVFFSAVAVKTIPPGSFLRRW